jgi:hypothetical protein
LGMSGDRSKREDDSDGEGTTQFQKCVHGIAFSG